MRILALASLAAALAFGVWVLAALRRWTRSAPGRASLAVLSPGAVVPAQTAVVVLWWQIVLDGPWTFYGLYQLMGDWSLVLVNLIAALVFVLLPGSLVILDAAWLRLHRIPSQWTVGRVWAWFVLILIACVAVGEMFPNEVVRISMGVVLLFAAVSSVFLTAWWIVSHPVVAD